MTEHMESVPLRDLGKLGCGGGDEGGRLLRTAATIGVAARDSSSRSLALSAASNLAQIPFQMTRIGPKYGSTSATLGGEIQLLIRVFLLVWAAFNFWRFDREGLTTH